MIVNVKARYANGVLTPLEPLDLEEGTEVTVSVEGAPAGASEETPTPKQGLAGIVERVLEMQKDIPPEAWDDLPLTWLRTRNTTSTAIPRKRTEDQ